MSLRALYERQVAECGFRSDPAQLIAVEALEELRDRLIAPEPGQASPWKWLANLRGAAEPPGRGLYLWGGVGRGKTWLMDLFFQSLPFPERRRRHFHRFMREVHSELKGFSHTEAPLERVAERIAREARILCFDELYVTDIADAMILAGIFRGLFRRGVVLLATSNVAPRDLYKNGLQRERFLPAIELIERHLRVLAIEGDTDYRLRQLTQAGTYLAADAPDTHRRLESLFEQLAQGAGREGGTTEIEGREIEVVREGTNVIWFDFQALCAGPRSQNDYIEIARNYQSVILENVPRFDTDHEDEARRFIALIDELYDRHVNLVVSAAAAPEALYGGARLAFEFRRAASRLIEMQSEEYLAREHLS